MRVWLIGLILAQSAMALAAQNGVITGRVLFADGTPAVGKRVAALTVDDSEATALMSIGETDSSGRYALERVPPGRYYLTVGSLDLLAYFPGVWIRTAATVVTVKAGIRQDGFDFRLPVPPNSVKVQGRLVRDGAEAIGVPNVEVRLFDPVTYTVVTDSDGYFIFPAVELGTYRALASTGQGRTVTVRVGPEDITDLQLLSAPGFRVAGQIMRERFAGLGAPQRLRLIGVGGPFTTDVLADGSFDFSYVPRGNFRVEVEPPVAMPFLTITVSDADLTNLRWMIPRGFRVAGQITREDKNYSPAPSSQIRLTGGPSIRGSATIEPDGSFDFAVVVPGKYQAELIPAPPARMPVLEIVVADKDLTGIRWMIPDPAKVDLRALLESSNALDQAWGGWTAGESARTELIPFLEKALAVRLASPSETPAEEAAIDTITDALIRFDAKLPLATVRSLYSRRPAQSLILLSRMDSSANSFLLELLDSQYDLAWFGSANLLLKRRAPGLAASLLRGLQLDAHLIACDPGRPCSSPHVGGGVGFRDGGSFGLGNFPPWPEYKLSRNQGEALAPGPAAVFVERRVLPAGSRPTPDGRFESNPRPRAEDRLTYIRATAPEAQVNLKEHEDRVIEWHGREALDAEAESLRQDIVSRYSAMLKGLMAAGVLSAEEAAALSEPQLLVTVDDLHSVR